MKIVQHRFVPHLLAFLGFVLVSIVFFNPVLSGKVIYQSDIVQHNGMAKQQRDFIAEKREESYWMDNAFGGMPTYQIGANYPHHYIKKLDKLIRFLPRPSDYLFIYFLGIYILFMVMKVPTRYAFIGALVFGFSTYLIIILGVGHNAKAHAIAYMPLVISGIVLCFRNQLFWGFLVLSLGLALELVANHFQMTYYLLLLCLCIGLVYLVYAFKNKQLKAFFIQLGVMVVAALLAVGLNASPLLATQEYTDFSTRGTEELSITAEGTPNVKSNGLAYDYITEYSYGIVESLNLFIPNFMGGSSSSSLPKNSETYQALLQLTGNPLTASQYAESMPTYWGKQSYVAAPAYLGAGVVFLFLIALFLVKSKTKQWVLLGICLSLLLSWGDNLAFITRFFVDYVPLYNKFRAVSSIQVLVEFCVPLLAILGLYHFYKPTISNAAKKKALLWSAGIAGGICVVLLLFSKSLFDFYHPVDEQFPPELAQAIRADRQAMLINDTWRSFLIVGIVAGFLGLHLVEKIQQKWALLLIGIVVVLDLVMVDRRYVSEDDFVFKSKMERPFNATQADLEIQKDTTHFRVLDLTTNPFNSARASFFHHSIGGYHAAKPKRIQNLYEFYISQGNQEILNLMNVKYILFDSEEKETLLEENKEINGNAWFVSKLQPVTSIDEELQRLGKLDTKNEAVLLEDVYNQLQTLKFDTSPSNYIALTHHQPNKLEYTYQAESSQWAVFSEIYYPHGWIAKINGKEAPIYRVNYLLRGLEVPSGKGTITFEFQPQVVKTGSTISLVSSVLFGLFLFAGVYKARTLATR